MLTTKDIATTAAEWIWPDAQTAPSTGSTLILRGRMESEQILEHDTVFKP